MTGQAGFSLRGRNPDVLTCIANLSTLPQVNMPGIKSVARTFRL